MVENRPTNTCSRSLNAPADVGVMVRPMNKQLYRLVFMFAALLAPFLVGAADIQLDLNGFRLLQLKTAPENSLGKPFDTSKTDRSTAEAYRIDSDAYMVFEYSKNLPNNIFSIQITGYTGKALPFKGLVLGADVQRVNDVLGKPARIDKVESPNVSRYSYEGANYSVEIDAAGKLYSIRIHCTKEVVQKPSDMFTSYDKFKALVLAKDIKGIITMLRPDVEIYKKGKAMAINRRYADFVENPDKEIVSAILDETDSVLKEMKESEPEGELRMVHNFGVGEVYKFYKGRILEEIAFFPYNGKYLVYEIAFREKAEPGP